jgi:hypothetical protein
MTVLVLLTEAELACLRRCEQGASVDLIWPFTSEALEKRGLLLWNGEQDITGFYSLTPAGADALLAFSGGTTSNESR